MFNILTSPRAKHGDRKVLRLLRHFIPRNDEKAAFTLAEVLITLLIIGVVSSLVIPSVINDAQNAEFKTAYKKAFAVASQVTNQARSEGLFMARTAQIDSTATLYNFNVFKSFFSLTKECINNNNGQCWNPDGEKACDGTCGGGGVPVSSDKAFVDNSGMAWSLFSQEEDIILVDTNGDKAPNKYGRDRWQLVFKNQNNNRILSGLPHKIAPLLNTDVVSFSDYCCHYPPCYFKTWLTD